MSSSTATPVAPTPAPQAAPPTPAETLIEQRLRQARRHVRGVDAAAGLLRLAVGVLLYLLAVAVLDHWLVDGGLGGLGRFLAATALLAGAGVYFARAVVPALVYRIHPLFAAQALERGRPGVKNSLINFLMLREHRQELQPVVYDTVQRRAANDIASVEMEAAVQRTHVFRLGYVLAAVLAVCCLYFVLSPKSLLTSAARVLWPFGNIPAPTRVVLGEIEPGDATVYLGDTMTVTAVARGLRDDEPVTLYFSTDDGQLVNQAVPMTLPDRDFRHRAKLPPGGRGFQQDGAYVLAAGDFRSEPFRIEVQTAPAIVVDRVVLEYPSYTGLAPRTLRRQGDLQGLEGTRATIVAEANQPIRRAEIDLSSDGKHGVRMKVDDRQAIGTFTLRLDPNDPARPQHDNYQLRFVDTEGRANPRPIRHRVEVIRDLPPEVALLEPREQQVRVAADGQLTIRVRAEDPDFGLRRVSLRAVSGGRDLKLKPLLAESAGGPGFRGTFTGEFEFRPRQFALKPGDRVLYWAEAEDFRQPNPGRGETDRRWLEVVEPTGRPASEPERREPTPAQPRPDPSQPGEPEQPKPPFDRPEQPEEPSEPDAGQDPSDAQPSDETAQPDPPGQGEEPAGDEGEGEATAGDQGAQPGDGEGAPGGQPEAGQGAADDEPAAADRTPIDPDTNPGDAIERILEHRESRQAEQPEPAEQPQQGEPQQPGEQSADQQPGDPSGDSPQQQPGEQPQPRDQPGTEPSDPSAGQEAGRKPEQPEGGKPGDGQPAGEEAQPGEQPAAEQQPGGGDQPAGQPGSDAGEPGGAQDQATPGEKPPGTEGAGADPQGGPADDTGEQPPGQMQPSPAPSDSAQRQPGTTGQEAQPRGSEPSDGPAEPGTAEQSGGESGSSPEGTKPEPGGEPQDGGTQGDDQMQEQSPGAGTPSQQPGGSPSPQEDNVDRPKTPGQVEGESSQGEERSPSISPKQSDTEGDTAGDRSGGGEEGGGQQANEPGVGSPGSQTDAESGGGVSPQQGDDAPGTRPGDQVEADQPTGSSAQRPGDSGGQRGRPGGQQPGQGPQVPSDGSMPPGQGMQQPPDGGQPGEQVSEGPGAHGAGSPTHGGDPDPRASGTTDRPAGEPGAEAANLEFARKQTQLALEHLKDQANQPNSDLLEQLGWSETEARRFIEQWEQLQQRAGRNDPAGREAQRSLNQALRSLGLRPRGTELRRGATPTERIDRIRDAGRFRPPSDWAEQFEAYTRSIAEDER